MDKPIDNDAPSRALPVEVEAQPLSSLVERAEAAEARVARLEQELAIARIYMPRPAIFETVRSTGPNTPPTRRPTQERG